MDKIHEMTRIDKWFLERLQNIHYLKNELSKYSTITGVSSALLRKAKQMGFSDFQIGRLTIKDDTANCSSENAGSERISERIGYCYLVLNR